MKAAEIRQTFLNYFKAKNHEIVPSAPMVMKNDPTLMFTNAGMNQFKDLFLGNSTVKYPRIADTQKCLRVSGKHNDLEEVGVDTYHHTMFEMLGNWSFGDYFKKEAIDWAWDLLVNELKIDKASIYATIFEGDSEDGTDEDIEAYECWLNYLPKEHILKFDKKDNFWEMGDVGPCGPCSEIHIDLRSDDEKKKIAGAELVNKDNPQVVEIWNLVFMQYNRLANGKLESLPAKHVDTGMGFERLCMVLQNKKSNYDTDVFSPLINHLQNISGINYGAGNETDIAIRVIVDHIRAIAFSIADGQLPSNNKAGYVIRRILRRAVRYSYTYLHLREPVLYSIVPVLSKQLGDAFPELKAQEELITKVVKEEEQSFLKTLETGLKKFEAYTDDKVSGSFAFELYDTYGFPIDLTQLIAKDKGKVVDMEGFHVEMKKQKDRSRKAAASDTGDWIEVNKGEDSEFVGYEKLECESKILKYRQVKIGNKEQYQLILDKTPFYAESGGQVGDTGYLEIKSAKVEIIDTQKENNLIIHFAIKIPADLSGSINAVVNKSKRRDTVKNHSVTHLLHAALKQILGDHVAQKGSLVNEHHTRFDFSHFEKVTDEQLKEIERIVNNKIQENINRGEQRDIPIKVAMDQGATALFGEKYGEKVRVITFDKDFSIELCGGTHVNSTGEIGLFKIISESSVAAGIRRIEGITGQAALNYMQEQLNLLGELKSLIKNPKDPIKGLQSLINENTEIKKELQSVNNEKIKKLKSDLGTKVKQLNGIEFIAEKVELNSAEAVKQLSFDYIRQKENTVLLLGAELNQKPHLSLIISESIVKEHDLNASIIIRELAKEIKGGGGGQNFYATAGGQNVSGLGMALSKAEELIQAILKN